MTPWLKIDRTNKLSKKIIVGRVQSGKTLCIIEICDFLIEKNITPVVIVRNRRVDVTQFTKRYHSSVQNAYDITAENFQRCVPVLVMGNVSQLGKTHEILCEIGCDFSMIVDEGDVHYQTKNADKKPTEIAFETMRQSSINSWLVTATVASLVINQTENSEIFELAPREGYVGVDKFEHVKTICENTYDFEMNCLADIQDIEKVYTTGLESERFWLIHNTTRMRFVQYVIADHVQENFPEFVTVVFNGEGTVVHIPQGDGLPHKCIVFESNIAIGDVMHKLRRFKYLTIIVGDLAARGISFVSSNYQTHMDAQYFRGGKKPHGEALLQACRLSGVYTDSPSLRFFTSSDTWCLIKEHYDYATNADDNFGIFRELDKSDNVCRAKLQ